MKTHRLRVVSSIEQGKGGGAFAAMVMALAIAACTRTMSLGAAGTPDGGDVRMSNDAGDAQPDLPPDGSPDVVVDAAPDVVADTAPDVVADTVVPDVPEDGHVDQATDVPPGMSCIDNGITYHSGDVVLRLGCQLSCICTDGVVGACTGIPCPVDGSAIVDPIPVATITFGDALPDVQVSIDSRGEAQRTIASTTALMPPPLPRSFPPGSPEVTLFLYHLQRVGDLTKLSSACPGSNGIRVTLPPPNSVTSGNLRCLLNPTGDSLALDHDAEVLLGLDGSNDSINAQACNATGGTVSNSLCCSGSGNFPNTCAVGACSGAPPAVHVIDTCLCPAGGCFQPSVGCVGPANVCTVGDDQTCNDNPALDAFHGHCVTGGSCSCITGSTLVAASGKCS